MPGREWRGVRGVFSREISGEEVGAAVRQGGGTFRLDDLGLMPCPRAAGARYASENVRIEQLV